ncbi:MAG: ATP:cob(I)alamin adenosyltransferase [Thermoguttaceae bacterium]|nr:ATP:cob(I)alamin adenosyltransferase [Thermoguttaceae bacterium]
MTIYSRTGDNGQTDLFPFGRISKTAPRMEALGTLDELNACLGLLRAQIQNDVKNQTDEADGKSQSQNKTNFQENLSFFPEGLDLDAMIESYQKLIFRIASEISCANSEISCFQTFHPITASEITELEKTIDTLEAILPPLSQMICFQGPLAAAHAQLARSVCRRAERTVWKLSESSRHEAENFDVTENAAAPIPSSGSPAANQVSISPHIHQWLNRFSDFLFLLGRKLSIGKTQRSMTEGLKMNLSE